MPSITRIVCLANSFKNGGVCIAGKEVVRGGYGRWIRPVSARPTAELRSEECRYANGELPKLLDVIDVPLLKPDPCRHQTENYVIETGRRWVKLGELPIRIVPKLEDHPATLWINSDRTATGVFNCISREEAATLHNSLVLIRPDNFVLEVTNQTRPGEPNKIYHGAFEYNGTFHVLKLTDPEVITRLRASRHDTYPLQDAHICVSLTEPYVRDNRCHKLVAAVFSAASLK